MHTLFFTPSPSPTGTPPAAATPPASRASSGACSNAASIFPAANSKPCSSQRRMPRKTLIARSPPPARYWSRCDKDKETRRQGDKETRRQGDKETRRQGDKRGETGQCAVQRVSLSPCPPVSLSFFSSAALADNTAAPAAKDRPAGPCSSCATRAFRPRPPSAATGSDRRSSLAPKDSLLAA